MKTTVVQYYGRNIENLFIFQSLKKLTNTENNEKCIAQWDKKSNNFSNKESFLII